jgi:N-acyl amino acid synthase of PEP-CTERM/exosortase system
MHNESAGYWKQTATLCHVKNTRGYDALKGTTAKVQGKTAHPNFNIALKSDRFDPEPGHLAGPVNALSSQASSQASRQVAPTRPGRLQRAFELRYQVYCVECSFLAPEDYPDGVESDEHDASAAHFYAFDADDELVGYVRLVRPGVDGLFPIQKRSALSVEGAALPAPGESAEISRLMVRGDYRRRRGDRLCGVTAKQNTAVFAGDRRCEAPQILLSLYRQMYAYSREHGIGHWYAAMERPLARSLLRLDFAFRPIGPQIDYYGPVEPYVADLRKLEAQVGARRPALLAWLQEPERRHTGLPTDDDDLDSWHLDKRGLATLRQVVTRRRGNPLDDLSDGQGKDSLGRNAADFSIGEILGERSGGGGLNRVSGGGQSACLHPAAEAPMRDRHLASTPHGRPDMGVGGGLEV